MKTLITTALFVLCATAHSAEPDRPVTVGVHLISAHADPGYNNNNFGGYVMYRGFVVGGYRNSENRNSAYAGYSWRPTPYVAITVSVASGYARASAVPLISASLIGPKFYGVRPVLTLVPPTPIGGGLMNFGVEF